MAKPSRSPLSLGALATKKPGAVTPARSVPASDLTGQEQAKAGRPRTLPSDFQTVTVRVSRPVRKALRQAALNHDKPIQQIITDGIMDQLARLAVPIEAD